MVSILQPLNFVKMDKFLLAENPFRPDESGLWIIHMIDPHAIIECDEEWLDLPPGKFYKHFQFKSGEIIENWTLSIHFLFSTELDSEQHHKIVNHILDRAWRWFRSYLEWENKQING